jgi:type III restriction enzyme
VSYEVETPIINGPFAEPARHWFIRDGQPPELRDGRRPALVYPPSDKRKQKPVAWTLGDTLAPSTNYAPAFELALVNRIRERVRAWRAAGYPGVTRTTFELLTWQRREGREERKRQFFAQVEAVETIIFLTEARADFRQGVDVPRDEPSEAQQREGYSGFTRYACKMATGTGKTTVMAMLAAWSILNKVNDRGDARFSDVVLVVCPNVTIRGRLRELDPQEGEGSIYATREIVPAHLMPLLAQGRVLVKNWHEFGPQTSQAGGESARVVRTGREVRTRETIKIGPKSTTARGSRYLTEDDLARQVGAGLVTVVDEERDKQGALKSVKVEALRYVQSDAAIVQHVLGRDVGGKKNILVLNDEAHHAYRIRRDEPEDEQGELFGEDEEADEFFQEATVWIEGLDRIHKLRGINLCVDLSATPYFLGRVGQETNRPFPWVVSDFGLIDAIESGLTKIPQLAVRDTTGAPVPGYFNIWDWILPKLTGRERGGKRANPKPEAILKYAHTPIAMLAGLWEEERELWQKEGRDKQPVFILVCKTTELAKVFYEWLAEDKAPMGIPPAKIEGFRNRNGVKNTIRVDTKVVHETDTGEAKSDESRWMRFTLDTVGRAAWPTGRQGEPLYPAGFEELAKKLDRPLHPPGRDVRCIVSVGMLTEGWDCTTVTHIIGLRPFQSQLLCEQVVGRGLRRAWQVLGEDGLYDEEVAKVFGVPFEVIPFKQNPQGPAPPPRKRTRIYAVPSKAEFEIKFPRVDGYTQAVKNRVTIDWSSAPGLVIDPNQIPPEVEVKGLSPNNEGRQSLSGPGRIDEVTLAAFRQGRRLQEAVFDVAAGLTRFYLSQRGAEAPAHKLFPQLQAIVERYAREKLRAIPPAEKVDCMLSPYYGWLIERLVENIRADASAGEAVELPIYESHRGPGSTADVDYWTTREDLREAIHCHLNYVLPDTARWEQSAMFYIDRHPRVQAFVKNTNLGFAIPYFHNGQMHDYVPDFLIRLAASPEHYLVLEIKGYDPLAEVKQAAAKRWASAVSAEGTYGQWSYRLCRQPTEVGAAIEEVAAQAGEGAL